MQRNTDRITSYVICPGVASSPEARRRKPTPDEGNNEIYSEKREGNKIKSVLFSVSKDITEADVFLCFRIEEQVM